jgi:predicted Zn finger-like uncharacterized protein
MDLYTRCAHCDTSFRVTTQQLQASGGQVRCGHCHQIFDAFATLTAQEPRFALQQQTPVGQSKTAQQPSLNLPAGEDGGRTSADSPPSQKDEPHLAKVDPAASLYEWEFKMPESPPRTGLWAVLSLVLLVVISAQAAYAFRTEVTMWLPYTRTYYVRLCESLGCTMGLPRLSNFLHIEASDLKTFDPAYPNEIQLFLTVRNRAAVEMAYPAFELTLTDSLERTIARRVFLPAEYLRSAARAGGLKPGVELPIQLFLDTGSLIAAGYRLYLFYP